MSLLPFEEEEGGGEALKAEGMSRAIQHVGSDYQDQFERAVRELAKSGKIFTADDVTKKVGFPRGHSMNRNNAVGAMMSACARRGIIVPVDYQKAERSLSHARVVRTWRGARRA